MDTYANIHSRVTANIAHTINVVTDAVFHAPMFALNDFA